MSKRILISVLGAVCIIYVAGFMMSNYDRERKLIPVSERNQKVSDVVEMYSSDGQELTVYEMSIEEYDKTDFRVPTKVVDDETARANYKQTDNVADIINNLSCVSEEVLDAIFVDYIEKTNDIGMLVVVKDYLSQESIDQIVKKYVKDTKDIGILEVLKDSVSKEIIEQF